MWVLLLFSGLITLVFNSFEWNDLKYIIIRLYSVHVLHFTLSSVFAMFFYSQYFEIPVVILSFVLTGSVEVGFFSLNNFVLSAVIV